MIRLISHFIKLLAAKHSAKGLMQFLTSNSVVNGIVVEILKIFAKSSNHSFSPLSLLTRCSRFVKYRLRLKFYILANILTYSV